MTDRDLMKQALEAMEYADACLKKQLTTKTKHEYAQDLLVEAGTALRERLAQPEHEFIKHHGDDEGWSEWACPDPDGYLMKCCDCGLVHEAEFGVVRYKSETEREDCDRVDDPNLQAVFRMRRSEQWSPEDTAHRAGGLPMEQPAQQVVDSDEKAGAYMEARLWEFIDMAAAWPKASPDPRTWDHVMVYAPKPAQRTWVGLTNNEVNNFAAGCHLGKSVQGAIYEAEAKLKEKNT